jgi:hydroxymethylglutaryl-CoA synthase
LVGIAAYGAYIPKYRLGAETLGWNSNLERSVANFDEDSVTMAVAAGRDCLRGRDRQKVDGLIFASTTPPYAEKQCAAIIAAALDLRRGIFTADMTGVLRAGTAALKTALDSVAAGSARQFLVIAADSRQGTPRGDTERNSGDGAAALLVSQEKGIATLEGAHSITDNMLDTWRSAGDPFVRSWEDRFATEEGLERILGEAVAGFFQKQRVSPGDVSKVALYAPDARRHSQLARRLGFAPEQVQAPLFGRLGNTGAAFPLILLVNALEEASPGQLLLVVSYGDGSDVLSFRATGEISNFSKKASGVTGHLDSKRVLASYETYARWREVWTMDDAARRPAPNSPSVTALWRETDKNLRLYGAKCDNCGYIQYPAQRVCVNCQARDAASPVCLSEQPGTVFTYSMDYLAATTDTPLVITVVDFAGGGRLLCMMTDRELDEVKVGMPVEMSFRKLRVVSGIHNYYWKAVPRRQG